MERQRIGSEWIEWTRHIVIDYLHPNVELFLQLINELGVITKTWPSSRTRLKHLVKKVMSIYTWKMYGSMQYSRGMMHCLGTWPNDVNAHSNFEYKRIVHVSWPIPNDLIYWHRYGQSGYKATDSFYQYRPNIDIAYIISNNSPSIAYALLALNNAEEKYFKGINHLTICQHLTTLLTFHWTSTSQ
jgi:hypothetical protein